jgi:hypothetical protein
VGSLGWRTIGIVNTNDIAGKVVRRKVCVIATQAGLQIATQIDAETTVILPDHAVAQMIVNVREALFAKPQGS